MGCRAHRSHHLLVAGVLAASIGGWDQVALAATLLLRGAEAPLACERIDFELGGVRVTRSGVPSTIPWDRVAGVTDRVVSEAERRQLAIAEDLWRARSRVQRGDHPLATPLFERHFEAFRGTTSETALIVAEGLLRCYVATGRADDRLRAIVPAIEAARLRRAGITTDRYSALAPILDEGTLLCSQLAPVWQTNAETERQAALIERIFLASPMLSSGIAIDAETIKVARIYAILLRGPVTGQSVPPSAKGDPAGGRFLAAVAEAILLRPKQDGDSDEALAARTRTRTAAITAVRDLPPAAQSWGQGWARFAVGRSSIAESQPSRRMDGVLDLLAVAALERNVPAPLVVESLRLSASTLEELGEKESAAIVERELRQWGGATPRKPAAPTVSSALERSSDSDIHRFHRHTLGGTLWGSARQRAPLA